MVRILLAALLLTLPGIGARAQNAAPPALTRHGNWVEGRVGSAGREGCIAGTPAPGRGSLQVTVGRTPAMGVILVLAVQLERTTFGGPEAVRFTVDGNVTEMPGQPNPGGPAMLVAAATEDEARKLSDLLLAMQRGRNLRVQVGSRPVLELSLSGASAALGAMRSCAQQVGMMPR